MIWDYNIFTNGLILDSIEYNTPTSKQNLFDDYNII